MDTMENLIITFWERMTQANELVIVALIILVPEMVNVYLFKFSLAKIKKEKNILVSTRQNSKQD